MQFEAPIKCLCCEGGDLDVVAQRIAIGFVNVFLFSKFFSQKNTEFSHQEVRRHLRVWIMMGRSMVAAMKVSILFAGESYYPDAVFFQIFVCQDEWTPFPGPPFFHYIFARGFVYAGVDKRTEEIYKCLRTL